MHPLTNDYVKKESRGTAVSFNSLAVVLGEIISIGVLFQFTKNLDFKIAFAIAGASILVQGVIAQILLKEPDMQKF